jgi:hypothetical protein
MTIPNTIRRPNALRAYRSWQDAYARLARSGYRDNALATEVGQLWADYKAASQVTS